MAIAALEPMLLSRTSVPYGARNILRLGQSLDRMESCYSALKALRQYAPDDKSALNAYSYLALVLNRDIDGASASAYSLMNGSASDASARIVAAFAKVRTGKAAEGLELIEHQGVDPVSLTPRLGVLVAFVLHANGQRANARQAVRDIPRSSLKAEDRRLMDSIE